MNRLALILLGMLVLFAASYKAGAIAGWAGVASYELPVTELTLSTGPINDSAKHWTEVHLDESTRLGLGIQCFFADATDQGETRQGEINWQVSLEQVDASTYKVRSAAPTTIEAKVLFKSLRHCTLVLHKVSGYGIYQGENVAFKDRYIYLANSRTTISWKPEETGRNVLGVVSGLFERLKLVGSIYYKRHLYLTMEDKSL